MRPYYIWAAVSTGMIIGAAYLHDSILPVKRSASVPSQTISAPLMTPKPMAAPRAEPSKPECFAVDSITVLNNKWDARFHNPCDAATSKRIYVRVAFYDDGGYRHGFQWFLIEPMQPNERARIGDKVPRVGAVTARIYEVTTDADECLKWGLNL